MLLDYCLSSGHISDFQADLKMTRGEMTESRQIFSPHYHFFVLSSSRAVLVRFNQTQLIQAFRSKVNSAARGQFFSLV